MFGIVNLADKAGDDINTCFQGQFLGLDLVAHRGNGVYRWSDESDIFLGKCFGKAGTLRQKAIARMDSLSACLFARSDDLIGNQIRLCSRRRAYVHCLVGHLHKRRARIRIGIDRDRRDAHPARGLNNAASNFATVCD